MCVIDMNMYLFSFVYGYGMYSLEDSYISKSDGGTMYLRLYGYRASLDSYIYCGSYSTCVITCYGGSSCTNATISYDSTATIYVSCDESEGISCPIYAPNGVQFVGPTSSPTDMPTEQPTDVPTPMPTNKLRCAFALLSF